MTSQKHLGKYQLVVMNGTGSGYYAPGEMLTIQADPPGSARKFEKWYGGEGFISNVYAPQSTLLMPLKNLTVVANYRDLNSSGIEDIDILRLEVNAYSTTAANAVSRRAALYRWWRLLWHQGIDLSVFDETAKALLEYDITAKESWAAIDQGYAILEKVSHAPLFIPSIEGTPGKSITRTNWPRYHGVDGSQAGFSPDAGPSKGELAWRFPKGYDSNARPVLEDGKVFISGSGIDAVCFCLEESSGEMIWKGRQYGIDFYQTHGSKWDPVITNDLVLVRTGFFQEATCVFDKASGKSIFNNNQTTSIPFFQPETIPSHNDFPEEILQDNSTLSLMVFSPDRKSLVVADARNGSRIWQLGFDCFLSGDPIIVGNYIYLSQQNGVVLCINKESRVPLWQRSLRSELRGTISYCGSLLLIGSRDRKLFAIDPINGEIHWTFQAEEVENKAYQFFSSAEEDNGRIYIGAASQYVYCLDSGSGKLIWKYKLSDWIRSKPLKLEMNLYIATLDSHLVALKDDGPSVSELWHTQLGEHGITADLVGNSKGVLVTGRDLILYSVSPITGFIQWHRGVLDGTWIDNHFIAADVIGGGFQSSPTVVDGILYIGGPDHFINAIDADSGKEVWRFEGSGMISATPIVADGKVFCGQSFGCNEFFALLKDTGEPVWISKEYGNVWVSAAYANKHLFIGGKDGRMHCVDSESGNILWTYNAGRSLPTSGNLFGIYSNPISDEKNIYFGSWAGFYIALDQISGNMLWKAKSCDDFRTDGKPDSGAPVLWKDHIYVQKLVESVAAINKHTGIIEWEWQVPEKRFQNGTVAAHGNKVFVSASLGREILPYDSAIYALSDIDNGGKLIWEYKGGGGLTSPVVTDDKVIFGSTAAVFLTCLEPENGRILWRFFTGGVMEETVPAIYGDKFFAQCRNGYLYAIT